MFRKNKLSLIVMSIVLVTVLSLPFVIAEDTEDTDVGTTPLTATISAWVEIYPDGEFDGEHADAESDEDGVNFGTLEPGDTYAALGQDNETVLYEIHVDEASNINVDMYHGLDGELNEDLELKSEASDGNGWSNENTTIVDIDAEEDWSEIGHTDTDSTWCEAIEPEGQCDQRFYMDVPEGTPPMDVEGVEYAFCGVSYDGMEGEDCGTLD